MKKTILAAFLLSLTFGAPTTRAAVNGDIVSIGFPWRTGNVIVGGTWTTVVVDLNLEAGTESFHGYLRVEQRDRDGDRGYDEVEVHLSSDTGGYRRYWLYVPANPRQEYAGEAEFGGFRVTLRNIEGELADFRTGGLPVRYLEPTQSPEVVPPDDFLVLSISHRQGKVGVLETATDQVSLDRFVRVTHIGPGSVPELWEGLEAADAIIWDEADPAELSQQQRDALIEWTRHGGTLVLAAVGTINALNSYWGDLLPIEVESSFDAVLLPDFARQLLSAEATDVYVGSISVLDGKPDPKDPACRTLLLDEKAIPVDAAKEIDINEILQRINADDESINRLKRPIHLITERKIGSGRIVFVAATMADLLRNDPEPFRFYKHIFNLRREAQVGNSATNLGNVFSYLERQIGFERTAAAYLVLAVGFAIAYVAIATFGCWAVMRKRDWRKHNWTAFTVVAGAACIISLVGVQSVRGVTRRVHQLSIVDGWSNGSDVTAHCYVGLKTPTFASVDLWLKGQENREEKPGPTTAYLKPLPSGDTGLSEGTAFVDPARYRLRPNSAAIENVPIRATVKQLEGRWSGFLPGRIFAQLRAIPWEGDNRDWRFDNSSFIQNDLGVDLYDCILIQPQNWQGDQLRERAGRREQFRVFEIGQLPATERISLVDRLYLDPFGLPRERIYFEDEKNLKRFQTRWWERIRPSTGVFGRSEEAAESSLSFSDLQDVLMLATTAAEFEPQASGTFQQATRLSLNGIRSLNLADRLDRQTALFIGFADHAGPIRLCAGNDDNYDTIEPSGGYAKVMYRFLVPMEYVFPIERNNP